MHNTIFAFGEILWDCLPSGRHAGGAPFNVACHLAQLDVAASLISAVGQDTLGAELLQVANAKGVDTQFIFQARPGLPTGTVIGRVDPAGNATYEVVQPVAWDEIHVPADALEAAARSDALIFGSLAGRSPYNLEQLDRLLALTGPRKFFDVNLRPPFVEPLRIIELAKRADVLKLNDEEVGKLASYLRTGTATLIPSMNYDKVIEGCGVLADATSTPCICVTMGASGAILWDDGNVVHAPAPPIVVRDTVGAGDAFMAGLMVGLTNGTNQQAVLDTACRLGAYVASHHGATPVFPREMAADLIRTLKMGAGPAAVAS